jgi:hypothetical protein
MSFAKVGTRCQIAFRMATSNSRYRPRRKSALNSSAWSLRPSSKKTAMRQQLTKPRKLFTHTTPAQMEQMKPHFSSLALEFVILAGFFKD